MTNFVPLVSVDLVDGDCFDRRRRGTLEADLDVGCCLSDNASEGVAEGLIESAELVDEVKVAVLDGAHLRHQILIVVVAEAERMQAERPNVLIFL